MHGKGDLGRDDEVTAMIFFWRRREVLVTYSLEERIRVCSALAAHKIECEVDVKDLTAPTFGSQRGRTGTFGINMNAAIEYKISVDKDDSAST